MKDKIYAVKVGEYWAKESYNEVSLQYVPYAFDSFKDAYSIAQKTKGELYLLEPNPMDGEDIQMALEKVCDE